MAHFTTTTAAQSTTTTTAKSTTRATPIKTPLCHIQHFAILKQFENKKNKFKIKCL